jgi:hypothetical protein
MRLSIAYNERVIFISTLSRDMNQATGLHYLTTCFVGQKHFLPPRHIYYVQQLEVEHIVKQAIRPHDHNVSW